MPHLATLDAPLTILVVDDDPLVLRALARRLRGHQLLLACDVPTALEVLGQSPVDVVLTDYDMPGPDGISLLELMRRLRPQARRILMSANPPQDLAALQAAGLMQHFLPKPMAAGQMEEILAMVAGGPRRATRRRSPTVEVGAHGLN